MTECQYYKCTKDVTNKVIMTSETGLGPTITAYLCKAHAARIKKALSGQR